METVVFVLMLLVCFSYLLKQTSRKLYALFISSAVCALFVGFSWPYAIEQSRSQISVWLSDAPLMLDMAVLLTLEVALQMAFCLLSARIHTSGVVRPVTLWTYRLLRWFPGLLIFAVLFSLLTAVIFSFPGVAFNRIAWTLAAVVAVVIPSGSYALRWLLPEREIRLELLFLLQALMALLGIVASVNGRTAVVGVSPVDWPALGGIVLLSLVGLLCGMAVYRIKLKRIIKNKSL